MDGSWSASPPSTKRKGQRATVEIPVVIEHNGAQFEGQTVNVGLGGAFVDSSHRPAYGDVILLWLPLPGLPLSSPVRSVVRWTSGNGFGVQFIGLGAHEVYALCELMKVRAEDSQLELTGHESDLLLEVQSVA